MTKAVVQYLRGLDLSGVAFDPENLGPGAARRAARKQAAAAASGEDERGDELETKLKSFWPTTDILGGMCRLQWLKLNNTGLVDNWLPPELGQLERLESLSLARNTLERLSALKGWSTLLPALRSLNCRKNGLTNNDAIPTELFKCPALQVIDFSCNQLTAVPKGLEEASGLLVLNLSNNEITSIPQDVFVKCKELMLLDMSHNQLDSLPIQLRRRTTMQQLILSYNPLTNAQLRSVTVLRNLEVLHLAGTHRTINNIPTELDRLEHLSDLDLSENALINIPEAVFSLRSLRKLNVEYNEVTDLSQLTDNWPLLEYFNIGHNRIVQLPSGLTRLTSLRKLYVHNNQLSFAGIPSGIGKLRALEIFDASHNQLENIPESLCRCGQLRRLYLNSNSLLTLPDAIHYLRETLKVFDVDNNPYLRFPPKPAQMQKGAGLAYYNIDFSLEAQLRKICGKVAGPGDGTTRAKDPASRLRRLRRHIDEGVGDESQCVLEGMQRVARDKEALLKQRELEEEEESKLISAKRWKDQLSKPQLDYTGIFEEETGTREGVEMWELDEFYPKRVEEDCLQGRLFDGDCYIVLHTALNPNGILDWVIYYWIGARASLDKQTCAAIHAVNLRNFLGAEGRTYREEQAEESEEFLNLFNGSLMVLEGAQGETGFFHVEETAVVPKLYRLFGTEKQMRIASMPLTPLSLDPKFCYLIDAQSELYLWLGRDSRLMVRTKGRLLAEKINVRERLGAAVIYLEAHGRESDAFWALISGQWCPPPLPLNVVSDKKKNQKDIQKSTPAPAAPPPPKVRPPDNVPRDFIPVDWEPPHPILYDVRMGKGFLELPQVDLELGQLTRNVLDTKHVHLLDSGGELFVWMGAKSPRFLRSAGCKLAQELTDLMPRGCLGGAEIELLSRSEMAEDEETYRQQVAAWNRFSRPSPQACIQGSESQMFKAQFCDWEEAVAVDFTRTADSITRRGVDMKEIFEKHKLGTDLRALLAPRERPMEWNEALELMLDWNEELVKPIQPDLAPTSALKQFILVDGACSPIDNEWFGHFFAQDSYILIARYWDFDEPENEGNEEQPAEQEAHRTKVLVYFWQGREASDLAWLTFNFKLRTDMEVYLSENRDPDGPPLAVEFKRLRQQQEDLLFLSHFHRQLVIHKGRYRDRYAEKREASVQMYYIRANGNPISTRSVEVLPAVNHMNSCFTYVVKVPESMIVNDGSAERLRVWMWVGSKACEDDKILISKVAHRIFGSHDAEIEYVYEGAEPAQFWACLGGRRPYDTSADYMNYSRLFRLSNEQGFFCASEKCTDFTQDDLADDDAMMLDTGEQIYLWWGKKSSDVEQKLSLQATKLYQQHLMNVQPDRPRKLKLTAKNMEPHMFKRCFHGWGPFREPKDWSG